MTGGIAKAGSSKAHTNKARSDHAGLWHSGCVAMKKPVSGVLSGMVFLLTRTTRKR